MRSLAGSSFCYENSADRVAQTPGARAATGSWLSRADAVADRAASAGFVVSMIFLAVTAIYALSLSGAVRPFIAEGVALLDQAAFDAGFKIGGFGPFRLSKYTAG